MPCVVSNAGRNKEIIKDGENGYLATGNEEWVKKLSMLIEDESLRKKFIQSGRETIEERFSLKANAPKVHSVLKVALEKTRK